MQISKMKLADLVDLNNEEILSLNKKQRIAVERRLNKAAERRMKVIQSHGLESYAFNRYIGDSLPPVSSPADSTQSVHHKISVLQHFLTSKTSSYKGIKKVFKEEEIRIFGATQKGFKNDDERKRFWSAYMEFERQNPALMYANGASTRLQQFLGRETFWREDGFTAEDLSRLAQNMTNTGEVDIRARAGREFNI